MTPDMVGGGRNRVWRPGIGSGRWLALPFVIGCYCGMAGAEAVTRYECRFDLSSQNRGHYSETMTIDVQGAGWSVLVDDDLIRGEFGQPIQAKVDDKQRDRFSFGWFVPLKIEGSGGKARTGFRATVFTQSGEISISTRLRLVFNSVTPARGTCSVVKG